jgi:hypothetical protein
MRREFERAKARGIDVAPPDPDAEGIARAVRDGEAIAEADVRDFAAVTIQGGVGLVEPKEAVDFFLNKVPLRSRTAEALVRASHKRGLLTSATIAADFRALFDEGVREIIQEGVPQGEAASRLRNILEQAGMGKVSQGRLAMIMRTNAHTAYNAGRKEFYSQPAIRAAMPYLIYRTMDDNRVRESHEPMDNKAYPQTHPIWRIWTPPNGYN